MNPLLRNILAVIAGIFVGSVVNMGLVNLGPSIIPPPEGGDITTMEGLKATMHLFEPRHFLFPFLGHAMGTLFGAFVAAKLAASHPMRLGLIIGVLFLAGGIYMVMTLPSPIWFTVLDLLGAYLPMGWLGGWLASRSTAG